MTGTQPQNRCSATPPSAATARRSTRCRARSPAPAWPRHRTKRSPGRSAIAKGGRGRCRVAVERASPRCNIRPAVAYPSVEPFAENGVAKAEENRGERHAPSKNRPAQQPRRQDSNDQRRRSDQRITGSAVDDGEEDRALRFDPPDRIERQLCRLPQQMACGRHAQIEKGGACGGVSRHAMMRLAYKRTVRRRRALVTTRTELMLIAALAIIGLSSRPVKG